MEFLLEQPQLTRPTAQGLSQTKVVVPQSKTRVLSAGSVEAGRPVFCCVCDAL